MDPALPTVKSGSAAVAKGVAKLKDTARKAHAYDDCSSSTRPSERRLTTQKSSA